MWYFWRSVCFFTYYIQWVCDKLGSYAVKRCNKIARQHDMVEGTINCSCGALGCRPRTGPWR